MSERMCEEHFLKNMASSLAGDLERAASKGFGPISSGECAQLRRMPANSVPPPGFWKLLLRYVPEDWNRPENERAWRAVLQGMAIMALSGPVHDPERSLGAALGELFEAESSQQRFWRLLEARDEIFFDLLRQNIRMLARTGKGVDWTGIIFLCLTRDKQKRLAACRKQAMDFYAAQARKEGE